MIALLHAAAALASTPIPLDQVGPSTAVDLTNAVLVGESIDDVVAISGEWRVVRTVAGIRTWEIALPVRTRTLFFHRPPKGMKLLERKSPDSSWTGARPLAHHRSNDTRAGSWSFDSHSLRVRRPIAAGPPRPNTLALQFDKAIEREAALRTPGASNIDFVVRSVQIDDSTMHGLYLVPGARITQSVAVPPGGSLRFGAVSVPPEAADPAAARNGQAVEVELTTADGHPHLLATVDPPDGIVRPIQLDLSPWADQTVTLSFTAPVDGVDHHDAVMVTDPVVVPPNNSPPRIVVVFIDTLRLDAMSLYGNERPTSPGLDQWAADATVFTQARSVAPWTLPTARALFSGRAPELWGQVPDLATRLRAEGWATAFIAGNIYLSSNFDMADNWTLHRCINWPQAEVQVDRADRWLSEQTDRPALLVLHFMDMHLPYTEPAEFRHQFAGPAPEPFPEGEFHRSQVVQWSRDMSDEDRDWLVGRYHNNLAYIDSVLTPFLERLPGDATVILLSDHGEEFWDHGDFEHGHSLYDELLRVPMIARGPGFGPGTNDTPTSMLDVAPTILRAAGVDAPLEGVPLQDIANADETAYADRPIGFGRPLYGQRRWGVVRGTHKYTTWKSTETVVDLSEDPQEARNLLPRNADALEWRQHLSEALRTPVHLAYTLYPQRASRADETTVDMTIPGGVLAAWASEDPTLMSAVATTHRGDHAQHTWAANMRGTREAYIVPNGNPLEVLQHATLEARQGDAVKAFPLPDSTVQQTGRNKVLSRVRVDGRSVSLYMSVVPLPHVDSIGIEGFDDEVQAELEALGYLDR